MVDSRWRAPIDPVMADAAVTRRMQDRIAALENALANLGRVQPWTPDYTYGGAARTPTSPSGLYLRHGPLVTIWFTFLPGATESGSQVSVTNLPVAVSASAIFLATIGLGRNEINFDAIQVLPNPGTTEALLRTYDGLAIALNTANDVSGTATYMAA